MCTTSIITIPIVERGDRKTVGNENDHGTRGDWSTKGSFRRVQDIHRKLV